MEPSLSPTSTIQGGSSDAGAEPGIDPRLSSANEKYSHFEEDCAIDIIDYSAKDATFQRMHNSEFVELMYDTAAQKRDSPPPHWTDKKGSTPFRWISITGIDWNVLSSLALRYGKVDFKVVAPYRHQQIYTLLLWKTFSKNKDSRTRRQTTTTTTCTCGFSLILWLRKTSLSTRGGG